MNIVALNRALSVCVIVLISSKIITGSALPLTLDESYYLWWSQSPKLGYLDHPPMIAYLLTFAGKVPDFPLYSRWPSLLMAFLMYPLSWSLISQLKFSDNRAKLTAFFLCHANLLGIISGVIPTPDTPYMFFWLLALHEALFALTKNPKRWLSAGLATGLGIWSKYTMVLIGPVFLWALLCEKKQLRSKWPYLGGVVCLIVLLPHLAWLQQNDWSSLKFQIRHGFIGDHQAAPTSDGQAIFPSPSATVPGSIEDRVGNFFNLERGKIDVPKPPTPIFLSILNRLLDYLGSQLVWWGFFLFGFIYVGWRQRKSIPWYRSRYKFNDTTRHLIAGSSLIPLAFFFFVSCFTAGEANWPMAYVIGASLWLAAWRPLPVKFLLVTLGLHSALLFGLSLHIQFPENSKKPHKDRLLIETHGFKKLAAYLAPKADLIMVDTYQMAAQLSLRLPQHIIAQWPDITRRSEFNYRTDLYDRAAANIANQQNFWLFSNERTPPTLLGYRVSHYEEIRDCLDGRLVTTAYKVELETYQSCEPYVHRWFLGHYVTNR